jgi:hypothetical protein
VSEAFETVKKRELTHDRADVARAQLLRNILPKPRSLKTGDPL